jgi:L-aminopeptidase/D-esterase-like protein
VARLAGVPAVLAVVLLASGCGGDGGEESSETTTTTTTTAKPMPTKFAAALTAAASMPKGPKGGAGTATITFKMGSGQACWRISVRGIGKAVSAHVHAGGPGKVGDVVIPLGDRFARTGCVLTGKRVLREVARKPTAYYVDVHSEKNIRGALRGRLHAA